MTVRFSYTNVLLYAISRDPGEADKARRANEILAAGDIGLSVQVLQEFYVQATRASRSDAITHEQATALIEAGRSIGCRVVLSEDLDTGTDYDSVRVENPFAAEARSWVRQSARFAWAPSQSASRPRARSSADLASARSLQRPGWTSSAQGWERGSHPFRDEVEAVGAGPRP